jgi:hypothetical protein
MTSGSSGWLADQFVDKAGKPGRPDGIVNYESVLLGLNAEGKLKDSLSLVVPSDAVVTANPREARAVPLKGLATLTGGELIEGLTGNLWPATVAAAYGVGVAVARLAKPSGGWHHGPPLPIARRAAR